MNRSPPPRGRRASRARRQSRRAVRGAAMSTLRSACWRRRAPASAPRSAPTSSARTRGARRRARGFRRARARSSMSGPGPVVTLYELEPAPGIKSSRVIGLADDIARSMSAVSARVAVVPGRNAIGIELPNQHARDRLPARAARLARTSTTAKHEAAAVPRQDHRRRAGHRRPRPHAAPARRRHHRLGQVGRHQHHDPVAALPAAARAVPADHGRPEDAGALRL